MLYKCEQKKCTHCVKQRPGYEPSFSAFWVTSARACLFSECQSPYLSKGQGLPDSPMMQTQWDDMCELPGKVGFHPRAGGGCWWREEWAVNSSSRLVLEVEHLGRTFTPFSVKPVWSSYPSIHPSFTLFTHICMYSFILLFIQPFFTEDLAACKRLLMQRWTKQVVSLGGCKRIAWMQRWHLASLSTVLCVGFLDIKTWQHGTIKLSPRIKGTKEVDVLHMSRVE